MTEPASKPDSSGDAACVRLPWDSEFFGVTVGRVSAQQLDPEGARAVRDWARANAVRCVYFLNEPPADSSIAAAKDVGFQEIDERVELELALEASAPGVHEAEDRVGPATADEERTLAAMARELHVDSRFFEDPNIPDDRARELYARWVENSFRSSSDEVLVARVDGQPAGYVACQMEAGDTGRIGLIGVAGRAQGAGLGTALVRASIAWFRARGARRVLVVTQGRNEAALRLYTRSGFSPHTRGIWLHLWALEARD